MTALRTLSLPFPPEGRSPVPTPPRWGTAGSIMSGACWVLPAPGSLREKKDSPPPMASHEAPRPPPCPPSLWGGGHPQPLHRAELQKAAEKGWSCPDEAVSHQGSPWGSPPGHRGGRGDTCPSSTHRHPRSCPHRGARDPASIACCRAPHRGVREPVLWISKCFD